MKLHRLYNKLKNETVRLSSNSVESWYEEYVKWMKENKPHYVDFKNSSMSSSLFYILLPNGKFCDIPETS